MRAVAAGCRPGGSEWRTRGPAGRTGASTSRGLAAGIALAMVVRHERSKTLMDLQRSKKVIAPMKGKNGRTYWMRVGNAWINKDDSINVYLDAFPNNGGQLQIRDFEEEELRARSAPAAEPEPESQQSGIPF
jgi:hypothetical protein